MRKEILVAVLKAKLASRSRTEKATPDVSKEPHRIEIGISGAFRRNLLSQRHLMRPILRVPNGTMMDFVRGAGGIGISRPGPGPRVGRVLRVPAPSLAWIGAQRRGARRGPGCRGEPI